MKMMMIAALAAAQLSAAAGPAIAAELPNPAAAPQTRYGEDVELNLENRQMPALAIGASPAPLRAAAPREEAEEPRKKRKSTGDKVLTGAAVVLGIGALAVGSLLVAIFVN